MERGEKQRQRQRERDREKEKGMSTTPNPLYLSLSKHAMHYHHLLLFVTHSSSQHPRLFSFLLHVLLHIGGHPCLRLLCFALLTLAVCFSFLAFVKGGKRRGWFGGREKGKKARKAKQAGKTRHKPSCECASRNLAMSPEITPTPNERKRVMEIP